MAPTSMRLKVGRPAALRVEVAPHAVLGGSVITRVDRIGLSSDHYAGARSDPAFRQPEGSYHPQ